jgi:hypothetical protein
MFIHIIDSRKREILVVPIYVLGFNNFITHLSAVVREPK